MPFDISTARPLSKEETGSFDISTAKPEQQQGSVLDTPISENTGKSPIDTIERLKLSFADDEGREKYLRDRFNVVQRLPNGKFAAGIDAENLKPIDPEGMFNDVLGDLADLSNLVLPIAGQISGGVAGSAGGPIGTIVGGGLGAGAGEAGNIAIGRAFGVREQRLIDDAVDVAITTGFGAAGEGLAIGTKLLGQGAGKIIAPKLTNLLDKSIKAGKEPSKSLQNIAKIFRVTASVPIDDTVTAGSYGFNKALSGKYMNEKLVTNEIMPKFINGVIKQDETLGKAVGEGRKWAIKNYGSKSLEMRPVGTKLLQELSSPEIAMVDSAGKFSATAINDNVDRRLFKNVVEGFFSKNTKTGQLIPKNLTVREYLGKKTLFKNQVTNYFKSGKGSSYGSKAFGEFFDQIDEVAKVKVNAGRAITAEDELLNPFLKSNKEYSLWKKDIELLKANGLDITDVKDLKNFIRGDKVVSSRIENFTEGLIKKNESANRAFDAVAQKLPIRIEGGGVGGQVGTLYDELRKWGAAQGFRNSNPSFLRIGAIASILGGLGIVRGEIPKPAEIGFALAIGTPAGARQILRGGSLLGKTLRVPQQIAKSKAIRQKRAAIALLSQIVKQRATSSQTNRTTR